MSYFLAKFVPPRPNFLPTMTADEQRLMKAHGDYLQGLLEQGKLVCHGPVMDPAGGWGLSIFDGVEEHDVLRLTSEDPMITAGVGARYEVFPFRQLKLRA